MIEKMTKYSFILMNSDKEEFLSRLRELGMIDISRGSKPIDEYSEQLLTEILVLKSRINEIERGRDAHLNELCARQAALEKQLAEVEPWGEYDAAKLKDLGVECHFHSVRRKDFRSGWVEEYALEVISEEAGRIWFVVLGNEDGLPCKEMASPQFTAGQLKEQIKTAAAEIDSYSGDLSALKSELPEMRKRLQKSESDFSAYLAECKGVPSAENCIVTYEGFAPSENDEVLQKAFDEMDGVYVLAEAASVEDNPPIKFRNNHFVSMFEPLTDMYGRPAYNGFDPTPYISIFFLLFFAMCMGDMGYGIILIITGILLKKVKSFASLAPLVVTLGVGTVIVGFLFHTFFSMDMSQWAFLPDGVKKVFLPSKIAGYDGTMILALVIGVIHLCLAMTVKAVYAVKNSGFLNSLGTLGWTLLLVGGAIVGAFALAGVLDSAVTKTVIIVLGAVSAIGIFFLNDLHRNPLKNVGSGLWEAYNTATGVLGDVLSYLRLYALGLAGSMLGFAFNDLAKMAFGDGAVSGWIAAILIVIIGHTLNVAMAALGAFVHPLRLNFLEFFKNSGYEAAGSKYNPVKK